MLPLRVFGILTRRWEVEEILCVHVLAGVAGSSSGLPVMSLRKLSLWEQRSKPAGAGAPG